MSDNGITFTQDEKIYNGIDVSRYQGNIDFERVKASGIDVVYIKAGEGNSLVDPFFLRNYERATRADLIVGFYYYVTALNPKEAKTQAQTFFNLIDGKSFEARPVMDYENFDGLEREDVTEIGITFLEELKRLSGITPMIYTDAYSAQTIWDDRFSIYPLWLADYSNRDEFPQGITVWESWTGFQYSDMGEVDGIDGNVDLDLFKEGILIIENGSSNRERYSENSNRMDSPRMNRNQNVRTGMNRDRDDWDNKVVEYIVKPGDTLWDIARRYHTTVPAIVALNGIADPSFIYIGQVLRIPD